MVLLLPDRDIPFAEKCFLEYKLALAADIQGIFGMIKYLYGLDSHEKQETSMAKRLILEKI